ncbi:MAG: flagellar filament capping protein FliD [Bacteroidetes bacterium]|nr:flagellar filament capping protein FliD [Bacteroidota bacterium]
MNITSAYYYYNQISNLLSTFAVSPAKGFSQQVITSVIGNIQNMSSEQIFKSESALALKRLYNNISDLAYKGKKLTTGISDSVFNDRTATSSDTNVLIATAYDALSSDTGATEALYQISVTQLALSQENTGNELNGTNASVVNIGTNTFSISIEGQVHEISIEVVAGDTNKDVLQKLSTAINDANIAVTANVTSGRSIGTQQIIIKSDNTGISNDFLISDVSGNAITVTGANIITTSAQDASYKVDETSYTSGSNTVYLDNGMVTVNLLGVGDVDLTVAPDVNEVGNTITNFISELNSSIDFLQNNSDYINGDVLETINSFISDHKNELASFGIEVNSDGILEIDQDKLSLALNQNLGDIKNAFSGIDGLSIQINNYSSRIKSSPISDYSKESLNSIFAKDFYNNLRNLNQNFTQGMLFDTFI